MPYLPKVIFSRLLFSSLLIFHTYCAPPVCTVYCNTSVDVGLVELGGKDENGKFVIVGDDIHRKEDELGVLTVGLLDFLTDKNLLDQG